VSAEGRLGDAAMRESEWHSPGESGGVNVLAVSRGAVLALESRSLSSLLESTSVWMRMPFIVPDFHSESRLWSLGDRERSVFATSRVDLTCHSSVQMNGLGTCVAFDGTRTRFFTADPASKQLAALASIDGRFHVRGHVDDDWLAGWWDSTPVVLRARTREAIRMPAQTKESVYQLAVADTVVAAISWGRTTSLVRIYPFRHLPVEGP
jgi:hypothetical protein